MIFIHFIHYIMGYITLHNQNYLEVSDNDIDRVYRIETGT